MRTFNRDMFRKRIHIKRTRGNRVFEFTPTDSTQVNRQFPQLFVSYQRLLPIHSLRDLDEYTINLMADMVEKYFINIRPTTLQAIDIIDTYCYGDSTIIYLYDKHENYLGFTITCAPNNLIYQVINSRCKEAEFWSTSKDGYPDTTKEKCYLPKYTRNLLIH